MKRLSLFLFGLLLCLGAAQAKPPAVQAAPPIWQVTDKDSGGTATLFGSVHLLPANVAWKTGAVEKAAADADVFVFEVPVDASTGLALAAKVQKDGMLPAGQSLHKLLTKEEGKTLDRVLVTLGIDARDADARRPWLVSLSIDMAQIRHAHQVTPGPDFVFSDEAKKAGKPVRYLETAAEQIALLAPDDPAVELDYLKSTLEGFDTADADLKATTDAWIRGDAGAIAKIVSEGFEGYPEEEARFFTDRNRRWVKKIAAMLKTGKRYLIVVGAGHLCGPNGVPALMRAEGYRVSGP